MIFGIIAIIGILVCIGATICKVCDFGREEICEIVQCFGIAAAIISALFAVIVFANSSGVADNLVAEYEELSLYSEVVEVSDNEYIRFDFNDRVKAYNNRISRYKKNSENIFLESFYKIEDLENAKEIEFKLRTGEAETAFVG
jgi:hypothetical protein